MISVIIVTYNNSAATIACLDSLYAHHADKSTIDFETILVDNASGDETVQTVREKFPSVTVLAQTVNRGFGAANNIGARAARGEYLFLLNNDTLFTASIMEALIAALRAHPGASAAAPRLVNADGTFQLSTGFIPSACGEWRTKRLEQGCRSAQPRALERAQRPDPDWVTAAALLVRADVFAKAGGFDERFFMYFEDVDLCVRLRAAAGPVLYVASLAITHLGGASWKHESRQADRIRSTYRISQLLFYAKHHGALQNLFLRCFFAAKFGADAFLRGDAGARTLLRLALNTPRALLERQRS